MSPLDFDKFTIFLELCQIFLFLHHQQFHYLNKIQCAVLLNFREFFHQTQKLSYFHYFLYFSKFSALLSTLLKKTLDGQFIFPRLFLLNHNEIYNLSLLFPLLAIPQNPPQQPHSFQVEAQAQKTAFLN